MTGSSKKSPPVKNAGMSFEPIKRNCAGKDWSDEEFLDILANTIKSLRAQAADSIVEMGFRLVEAKALVRHGQWLPWLESNFGWTNKTAENYMNLYKAMSEGKFETVSNLDLPIRSLYLLAAPNTPPEAVETVIKRAKTGEKVTGGEVKKVVHEAKSKSPRPPDSGTKKRGGEETKRHDERMKSARYKLEAFIRDYSDMTEWKKVIEAIKTQLGAKHV